MRPDTFTSALGEWWQSSNTRPHSVTYKSVTYKNRWRCQICATILDQRSIKPAYDVIYDDRCLAREFFRPCENVGCDGLMIMCGTVGRNQTGETE